MNPVKTTELVLTTGDLMNVTVKEGGQDTTVKKARQINISIIH